MKAFALIATAILTACPALAQSGALITHQFVVRIESVQDLQGVLEDHNLVVVGSYPPRGLYLVAPHPLLPPPEDDQLASSLVLDSRLILSEQNRENCAEEGNTQSFFVGIAPLDFSSQPTFDHIGLNIAPATWTGQGITIAILDTGVAPHFEYWSSLRTDGASFVDNNSPTSDFGSGLDTNRNGQIDELVGHGTFMAGLIMHVAPGCQILPVRVLDSDGVGSSFAVAAGIYYAVDHGAKVINLSLSSPTDTLTVREAVHEALAAGISIVASVGNNNSIARQYPAANAGVIAVTATDVSDRRLATSDFGPYIKFCAPGENVVSTYPGNLYATASGTSVSTALVAGAITRMHSRFPTAPTAFAALAVSNSSVRIDTLNRPFMGMLGKSLRVGTAVVRIDSSNAAVLKGP